MLEPLRHLAQTWSPAPPPSYISAATGRAGQKDSGCAREEGSFSWKEQEQGQGQGR